MPQANLVRWHNIASSFGGLNVKGIGLYGDRALLMSGPIALVLGEGHGSFGSYLGYLEEAGLGPKKVLRVKNMYDHHAMALSVLANTIRGNRWQIQFFHTTRVEEDLIQRMGLSWKEYVYGATATLSDKTNCKSSLRQVGAELGLRHFFPEHRICYTEIDVWQAVRDLSGEGRQLIFKTPRSASGDGMQFVQSSADMEHFCQSYLPQGEIIVERAFPDHFPVSAQWELSASGPRMACATVQVIAPDGKTHRGNIVCRVDSFLPGVSAHDLDEIRRLTTPLAEYYWRMGYVGILGFDLLRNGDGQMFVLETNGRVTATTYALSVGRQVQNVLPNWCVTMEIFQPSKQVADFEQLKQLLGNLLYVGQSSGGVIPFLTRLLPNKIGIMAVTNSSNESLALMVAVSNLLN